MVITMSDWSAEEVEEFTSRFRERMETEEGKQDAADAFVRAAYDEDIQKAKILLDLGVDINLFSSDNGCTALSTVMHKSSEMMIDFLLEDKADPNARD